MCELCKKEKIHKWYYEDKDIFVTLCKTCQVPMVVLKEHTMEAPEEIKKKMEEKLKETADWLLGTGVWKLDKIQKKIPDHLHWHARR